MWGTVRGGKVSSWTEPEGASLLSVPVFWSETYSPASWMGKQPSKLENCKRFAPQSWKQRLLSIGSPKAESPHISFSICFTEGMQAVFFLCPDMSLSWITALYCKAAVAARAEKLGIEALHHPGWDEQQHDTGSKAGCVQSDVLLTAQCVPTQHWHRQLHNSHIIHNVSLWSFYFHQSARLPYVF